MIKYIVYWTLLKICTTICPDIQKPDSFGRMPLVYSTCCVLHVKEIEEPHSRQFTTRDSAIFFMNIAMCQPDIKGVKLDSFVLSSKNKVK